MDRRLASTLIAAFLVANAGPAAAQPRSESVPARPREGTRIRVERPDGTVVDGWVAPRPAPGTPPVSVDANTPTNAGEGTYSSDSWSPPIGDDIIVRCPGDPQPVIVPCYDVVSMEVYQPSRVRMDYYTRLGAAVGLAAGLLMVLPDMSVPDCPDGQCPDHTFELADRGFVRLLACTAIGVAAGGVAGLLVEGHGVWKPVSVAWSSAARAPQVQVAWSF